MIRPLLLLCRIAGMAALAFLALVVAAEVVARNLLGFSLLVADEYAGYLSVAITFCGIPLALKDDALLRVDAVIERLKGRRRAALDAVFNAISALVAAAFAWQFARMALRSFARGTFASTPAQTPIWIPQLVMAIGSAILLAVALAKLAASLSQFNHGEGEL